MLKYRILAAAFLVAAGALAAEESAATPSAAAPFTVYGLKGPSGVGMVRMFEEPPTAEGVPVSLEALANVELMIAKLVSGEAKVGILPPNIAAKLAAAGVPLQAAAVVNNGMLNLLSADPTIRSIADLRGKSVEVAGQGATPDNVFRRILSANGLSPGKDVKLGFSLAYPEIAQALIAGRVAVALLPEPFATMALLGRPTLTQVCDVQAEWARVGGSATYPMTLLVVDARFAASRPAAVRAVADAYRASLEWARAHPAEAGTLVEKHGLGVKAAVAAAAIPKSAYAFTSAAEARPAIEALLRVFLETSPASIGGRLPPASFYLERY